MLWYALKQKLKEKLFFPRLLILNLWIGIEFSPSATAVKGTI
jgi:hypothetical protein